MNHLEKGDEEMAECHEAISEEFSKYFELYEKKAAKVSREHHEIIDSSEFLMRF